MRIDEMLTKTLLSHPTDASIVRPVVYLDHHATTPVDPRVAQLVFDAMTEKFGNAHSVDHIYGQTAAALVDQAAAEVADLLNASPDNVRFTSSASEAIRLALGIAAAIACPDLGESGDSQEALNRRVLARLIRRGLERCGDPILAR
jgi:selenocysteine lyase/cysteine desulfurase